MNKKFKWLFLISILICSFFAYLNYQPKAIEIVSAVEVKEEANLDNVVCERISCSQFDDILKVVEYAEENDYFYYQEKDEYCFYKKFALKTLKVRGNFNVDKYSSNIQKQNKYFTILSFETEDETELAYYELSNAGFKIEISQLTSVFSQYTLADDPIGWGFDAIEAQPYWDYLEENSVNDEVVVVVIDSGINTSHIKLKDRMIKENGSYVGYTITQTTANSSYGFEDDDGHGTHVAGIIADTTPSNVKIIPIKLLGNGETTSLTNLQYEEAFAQVAEYKEKYNVVAVNMSLSGNDTDGSVGYDWVSNVDDWIQTYLVANDIITLAAAGNKHIQVPSGLYPANCPSVVTVSALKQSGATCTFDASYSNYGSTIEISAPGTAINSSYIGSSTATSVLQGTSMATPYVSAVVALLYLDPIYSMNATHNVVKERLFDLAIDLGNSGKDIYYGYGMVSLKDFKGNIAYETTDTTVTYDGQYHNIGVNVTGADTYTIKYGLTISNINITDISQYSEFKNYTNGKKTIYFEISADNSKTTIGQAYLQINKANISVHLQNQEGIYGNAPNLVQSKYSLSAQPYGADQLNMSLTTSATRSSPHGSYPINFTYSNDNYNLITGTAGNYIVKKRDLKISLISQSITYGEAINLSAGYNILSGEEISGCGLNLTVKTDAVRYSPVTDYTISPNTYNDSYNLTCENATLSITQRPITINVEQDSVYGNEHTIDINDYNITSGSVVNGDALITQMSTTVTKTTAVGEHAITISSTNANYDVTITKSVINIKQRPATIVVKNQQCTYGNIVLNQTEYTLSNVIAGDNVGISLTTTATNVSPVNPAEPYKINATATNGNYSYTIQQGTLTLTKRSILVKVVQSFEYGNNIVLNVKNYEDINSQLVNSDDLSLVLQTSANNKSNVGSYPVTISSCNANYDATLSADSAVVISKRNISVSVGNASSYYGNAVSLNSVTLDLSEVVNSDSLGITLKTNPTTIKNVGKYPITFDYTNTNYNVTIIEGEYEIKQRPITVLIQKTVTYGDEIDVEGISYIDSNNKLLSGDNLNLVVSTDAVQFSPVGNNYKFQLVSANSNYDVTIDSRSKLTISAKRINVTIGDASSKFGEAIDLSDVSVDTSEVLNNDNLNITLTTTATRSSVAGEYPISLEYSNPNYDVNVITGKYLIYNKTVSISLNPQTFVYGDKIVLNDDAYTCSDAEVDKATLNIKLKTNAVQYSSVGSAYKIEVDSHNTNYLVEYEVGKLSITPKPITVKVEQEKEYGDEFVFDGKFLDVNSAVVNNDDLNLTVTTTATKFSPVKVGKYELLVDQCNNNYVVSLTADSGLVVKPRNIVVSVGEAEKTYLDDVDLTGVTVDTSEVLNNDDLNIELTTTATKTSVCGDYEISFEYDNANYNVTKISGKLTITKYKFDVKIGDKTITYGDEINVSDVVVSTIDENVNIDEMDFVLETTATGQANVGDYEISIKSYISLNYEVENCSNGTLTITKKSAEMQIGVVKSIYGEKFNLDDVEIEFTGLVGLDVIDFSLSTTATQNSVCGEYPITATINNGNYDFTIWKGCVDIDPKTIQIDIVQVGEYGDEHKLDNAIYDDFNSSVLPGDSLNLSLKFKDTEIKAVKKYDIEIVSCNSNYIVTLMNAYYEVTPKAINVTIGDTTSTYGTTPDLSKVAIDKSQVLPGDEIKCELSCAVTTKTGVGTYKIGGKCDSENYNVTFISGNLTVQPREIEIEVTAQSYYGDDVKIGGDFVVTSGSVVNQDNLQLELRSTATKFSPVNKKGYDLQVAKANANYKVTLNENSKHKILPRKITVYVGSASGYYKDAVLLNTVDVNLSEVVNHDDLLISLATYATNLSEVGEYVITLNYNNPNYDVTVIEGKYVIKKRPVQITIKELTYTYGDVINNEVLDYTYNDDKLTKNDIDAKLVTSASTNSAVGSYEIEVESCNNNVEVIYNTAKITIEPRKLKVSLNPQVKGHLTFFKPDQNAYTIVEGEVVGDDNLNIEISTNNLDVLLLGEFDLSATYNNQNYDIEFVNSTIKIEYSYVDTIVISAVSALIVLFIVIRVAKSAKRHRDNTRFFQESIEELKRKRK